MTDIHRQNDSPNGSDIPQEDLDRVAQPTEREGASQDLKGTHYAYDPQTYEILCRPGQRLSEKKVQRLQELNLYAHVVTFAESHSP